MDLTGWQDSGGTCSTCRQPLPGTPRPVDVGDVLHGHCGGAFGRDSYQCKQVEGVGADWVVCRNATPWGPSGIQGLATGKDIRRELAQYLAPTEECGCGEADD